jgi:putative tryptophan/tyrosine transport system substrate-binding protein
MSGRHQSPSPACGRGRGPARSAGKVRALGTDVRAHELASVLGFPIPRRRARDREPSPSHRFAIGPSLSRFAGEGRVLAGVRVNRRTIVTAIGVLLIVHPRVPRAQQPKRVVGFLHSGAPDAARAYLDAFRHGLADAGYVEGQNVVVEYRWAEGRYERLPQLAAELVSRNVDVIVATAGAISAQAAKAATRTIPIVFHVGPDPVAIGLVESLNHPGGNATGVAILTAAAWTKRLELAAAITEKNAAIGVLQNPNYEGTDPSRDEMQRAAQAVGRRLTLAFATTDEEMERGLESLSKSGVGAVLISTDPFLLGKRDALAALALKLRLPTIGGWAAEAKAGALMSYGSDQDETYYQLGLYTARVLKGEKPADLPVLQATRLFLVVNLKTAKALGIDMPPLLMALADEVIE